LPADGDLYAMSARELERMFETRVDTTLRASSGLLARDALRLARAHARVTGVCGLCGRAQARVESALAAADPDACDLGLALAQLWAKEGGQPAQAQRAADAVLEHAKHWAQQAPCVAAVRRTQALLGLRSGPEPIGEGRQSSSDVESGSVVDPTAFVAARQPARAVALQEIRAYGAGAREVRVALAFDGPARFEHGELAADTALPRRLYLDLAGVALAPGAHALLPVAAAGLVRVRAFLLDAATTRVSFDLAPETSYHVFFLTDPYRVIVDFRATRPQTEVSDAVRSIVLDPGHGGAQVGAHGPNGIEEAKVALSIALRARRLIERALPDVRVVMTRDSDRAVSLEERAAIANAVGALLFVSIHLNASTSASDKGGVSTYVLDTSDDAQALRLAARENGADERDVTDLQKLFAGLYRREQVGQSIELAELVHASTLRFGRRQLPDLVDRGVKRAMFYVLVGARMPAVLCEASFITRPQEAAALKTDAYRQALAQGIADGIVSYARETRPR
jgi:N-acetylmuramoyl-L-alanine amidase